MSIYKNTENYVQKEEDQMVDPFVLDVLDVGTVEVELKDGKFDVSITYCLWNNEKSEE
tara:strand:+ start:1236 stop:1409 length:174 start_codon:yes stop_codon:yes gene_type:complete